MYAGTVVERARVGELFAAPLHPYTQGLLASAPSAQSGMRRLATIEGVVPNLAQLPVGCRFRERCSQALAECARAEPALTSLPNGRKVACFVAVAKLSGGAP